MPLPSFEILLTVVSLLWEVIWYLQWRSTWLCFVARRFKSSKRGIANVFLEKI
ncbi:hypothetical protein Golax_020345 [Gossypium laxum]|uniref:Uncharacterized protein n=1 Tax=Gossypium laxum TaxID=34288 RepID=A0A7J9AZU7_9ROSI|nr:hypothetical protein [Gossypium laxum]